MVDFFSKLFSSDFMPHGHCYLWKPDILWLNVISDALIAVAYYSIPLTLLAIVKMRRDLVLNWVFVLFACFICACGTTHAMEIWTVWHGTYRVEGIIKLITAAFSVGTATALWTLLPRIPSMPTASYLENQVRERAAAQAELLEVKNTLESQIDERTRELSATIQELERFNDIATNREIRMIELKNEINQLCKELGRKERYASIANSEVDGPVTA